MLPGVDRLSAQTAGSNAKSYTLMTDLLAQQPDECFCFTLQKPLEVLLDSNLAFSGLHLDEASQLEGVSSSEAPEEAQPHSPQQRPPTYLSAMLTYMAQVVLSRM